MSYKISAPDLLRTSIALPASKSISNRALIIHALSGSDIRPENLSDCDDTAVIINALRDMPEAIDVKSGGTAMRFMTAYLSVRPGEHVITGTKRMRHRPIHPLVDALRYLGAEVSYAGEEGFPPLRICGKALDGGHLEIPGNVSSQYISALLMIGPVLKDGLDIQLTGKIISRPYIDLTICIMKAFGADAEWTGFDTITVRPKPYIHRPYRIESDWSAASYWYEMMALTADDDARIVLQGLEDGSRQGDSVARYLFSLLGVKTAFAPATQTEPSTVTLTRHRRSVPRVDFDFTNCPDLTQTFTVVCAVLGIPFHFTGLASLKIKETDRIEALKRELLKLGYVIKDQNGSELLWDGEQCEPTLEPIDTYEDHRMAMAFAPVAIACPGIRINHPEVVSKSYPHYWDDLQKAGFCIDKQD